MKGKGIIIVLTALAGMLSCQRDPVYGPNSSKEVNAKFIFNVSTLSGKKTKQSELETQASSEAVFRGIEQATLMTLARPGKDGKILAEDLDADKIYDLSSVVGPGTITSGNSRRVLEMSLPLGTNTLVFYGKAIKGTTGSDGFSADDCFGKLDAFSISDQANVTRIQLGKRLQNTTAFYATEKFLAGMLTLIMNHNLAEDNHKAIDGTATPDQNANPYVYSFAADKYTLDEGGYPQIYWSSYVNNDKKSPVEPSHDLYPLEEKLSRLYSQMTNIRYENNVELRAGSGDATLRIIKDLWSVLNSVRCAIPNSKAESVAKFFAEELHQRLLGYFAATVNGEGTAVTGVDYKSGIVDYFSSTDEQAYWPSVTPSDFKPTSEELASVNAAILRTFPSYFNIPLGGAFIAFKTSEKCFYYPTVFNTSAMSTSGANYNAESYYYPAELMYFSNSPLLTSDSEHKTSDYPVNSAQWNGEWSEDWSGQHVLSSTRSVAMKYDVDYGVAMLETKIGYKTTSLKDNREAVLKAEDSSSTEEDQTITVDGNSFKFTGLVIGGQPVNLGWNYLPVQVNTGTEQVPVMKYLDGFVYDHAVHPASQAIPATGTSAPNYTVVFDNFNAVNFAAGTPQDKVNVALEFLNNTGKDFYGNCNLIRNGGHFYLIGTLDPDDTGVTGITWPTDHVVPPYKTDADHYGESEEVTRVFIQDFKTSVTFKFDTNSLKYAYLTVPDLRASSLTLGLSVDIVWQQGLVYDEVVIGGN